MLDLILFGVNSKVLNHILKVKYLSSPMDLNGSTCLLTHKTLVYSENMARAPSIAGIQPTDISQ